MIHDQIITETNMREGFKAAEVGPGVNTGLAGRVLQSLKRNCGRIKHKKGWFVTRHRQS